MRRRYASQLGLVLGIVLSASIVTAETWRCQMRHVDTTGWISHRLEVQVAGNDTVQVLDSAIAEMHGHPIVGTLKENKGLRLQVDWITRNLPTRSGLVVSRPRYSAFINRETGRVSVSALLAVGDMIPKGSGRCKRLAGTGSFALTSAPRPRFVIEVPEW